MEIRIVQIETYIVKQLKHFQNVFSSNRNLFIRIFTHYNLLQSICSYVYWNIKNSPYCIIDHHYLPKGSEICNKDNYWIPRRAKINILHEQFDILLVSQNLNKESLSNIIYTPNAKLMRYLFDFKQKGLTQFCKNFLPCCIAVNSPVQASDS